VSAREPLNELRSLLNSAEYVHMHAFVETQGCRGVFMGGGVDGQKPPFSGYAPVNMYLYRNGFGGSHNLKLPFSLLLVT